MKAYICTRYGPPEVLELRDVDKPTVGSNDVLVKVHTTTVTAGDWRIRSRNVPKGFGIIVRLMFGFKGPRQPILGTELSGQVVGIGEKVTRFAVGDYVIGYSDMKSGAHAEFIAMDEGSAIVHKPEEIEFETAAALSFGGTTALHFLQKVGLKEGERLLVNGASGAVGSAAVQLGKHMGAHVTGVCSTANVDLVISLGADSVIDYKKQDVLQSGLEYDVVLDAAGTLPYSKAKTILASGGREALVNGSMADLIRGPLTKLSGDKKLISGVAVGSRDQLNYLVALTLKGEFKPLIDSRYAFSEMIEAHHRVDSGRKRGTVIVNVSQGGH